MFYSHYSRPIFLLWLLVHPIVTDFQDGLAVESHFHRSSGTPNRFFVVPRTTDCDRPYSIRFPREIARPNNEIVLVTLHNVGYQPGGPAGGVRSMPLSCPWGARRASATSWGLDSSEHHLWGQPMNAPGYRAQEANAPWVLAGSWVASVFVSAPSVNMGQLTVAGFWSQARRNEVVPPGRRHGMRGSPAQSTPAVTMVP